MRTIHAVFTDKEFKEIYRGKGLKESWHDYILRIRKEVRNENI